MTIFFYDYQSYEALFNGCCKDNASREQRCKLACKLCRGAAYLMQKYKLIRYNKKTFLVIMAKEIKINKRLIIDGKEQGRDLLSVFVWAFPFKEDQVSKCIPTNKIKNEQQYIQI